MLSLYRRKITQQNCENNLGQERNEDFFCTDYFDQLHVREIGENEALSVFLGIENQEQSLDNVISVQYYSIYRTEQDDTEDLTGLFDSNSQYPFLSLVHIYITPEVIGALNEKDIHYMEILKADLEKLLKSCSSLLEICGGVFYMMSAGDFMMVIRSKTPEEAYAVSTQIRRRLITKYKKPEENLTLFKTYTMLLFEANSAMFCEDRQEDIRMAVRGRFSNLYWKKEDESLCIPHNSRYLNGRYDFVVYMTGQQFQHVYPIIKSRKFGEQCDWKMQEDSYTQQERYLLELHQNGYVSYLNERCLIREKQIEEDVQKKLNEIPRQIEEIYLRESYTDFYKMPQYIDERCSKALEEIRFQENAWREAGQKTIEASYHMFRRLVFLCQTVNALSDTRIYVISLLQQLEVVLNSARLWLEEYQKTHGQQLLKYFNIYLRQAVTDLETYGSIIRNDNLQTLQAPNYRILAGCSIEKVLMAYSHFLNSMMSYCCQKLSLESEKQYLSVMIPRLEKDSLEVEVLFPKWFCEDKKEKGPSCRLLVARGPAAGRLMEPERIITALFHEMAHQLRFESRKERNAVLSELFLESFAESLIQSLIDRVDSTQEDSELADYIKACFTEVLIQCLKTTLRIPDRYADCSLEVFKEQIQRDLNELVEDILTDEQKLLYDIRQYLEETNEYIGFDEKIWTALTKVSQSAQDLMNLEQVTKAMGLGEDQQIHLAAVIKTQIIEGLHIYKEHCRENASRQSEKEDIDRMSNALIVRIVNYRHWLSEERKTKKKKFLDNLYKKLCEHWDEEWDKTSEYTPKKKAWIKIGRKLGIDSNMKSNYLHFVGMFVKASRGLISYQMKKWIEPIELYREKTSDLFMALMCNLDFSSYLIYCADAFPSVDMVFEEGHVERIADMITILWVMNESELMKETVDKEALYRFLNSKEMGGRLLELLIGNAKASKTINEGLNMVLQSEEVTMLQKKVAALGLQVFRVLPSRVNELASRPYLMKDFERGKEAYASLKNWFYNDKHNSCDIRGIAEICIQNQKNLIAKGGGKNESTAEHSNAYETFIVNMHAHDRLNCARELYGN